MKKGCLTIVHDGSQICAKIHGQTILRSPVFTLSIIKKGALIKAMIDQTRGIVRNLIVIYENSCNELIDKLTSSIAASLDKDYVAWKENFVDVPFSELLQTFSNFKKNVQLFVKQMYGYYHS